MLHKFTFTQYEYFVKGKSTRDTPFKAMQNAVENIRSIHHTLLARLQTPLVRE